MYRRKHNPFISFNSYTQSRSRCAALKDFNDLYNDIISGTLPHFSYVVPNMANDGHNTGIHHTARWYAQFVSDLTQSPLFVTSRVLVHVTYDEDAAAFLYYNNTALDKLGKPNPYYNASCVTDSSSPPNACAPAGCTDLLNCTLDKSNNQVYSVLFGSAIPYDRANTIDNTYYTHSSIVATLEANWDLGSLGRADVDSNIFNLSSYSSGL